MPRRGLGPSPARRGASRCRPIPSRRVRCGSLAIAQRSVDNAIRDLRDAFATGKVPNPATDDRYYNIKRMQTRKLQ